MTSHRTPQVPAAASAAALRASAGFEPPGARPCIGVVAPFDFALDDEYWHLLPPGVGLLATRTPYLDLPVGVEMAEAVSDISDVTVAARALSAAHPAAVVYACTSGSFVGGVAADRRLCRAISAAAGAPAVTVSGALLDAVAAVGARTVAIGTPYDAPVTERLAAFLAEAGYPCERSACLGLSGDIARIDAGTVQRLARAADSPAADVVFLSCTNLRTLDVLADLEEELGKPVLSANQVAVWAGLRAGGLPLPDVDQRIFRVS